MNRYKLLVLVLTILLSVYSVNLAPTSDVQTLDCVDETINNKTNLTEHMYSTESIHQVSTKKLFEKFTAINEIDPAEELLDFEFVSKNTQKDMYESINGNNRRFKRQAKVVTQKRSASNPEMLVEGSGDGEPSPTQKEQHTSAAASITSRILPERETTPAVSWQHNISVADTYILPEKSEKNDSITQKEVILNQEKNTNVTLKPISAASTSSRSSPEITHVPTTNQTLDVPANLTKNETTLPSTIAATTRTGLSQQNMSIPETYKLAEKNEKNGNITQKEVTQDQEKTTNITLKTISPASTSSRLSPEMSTVPTKNQTIVNVVPAGKTQSEVSDLTKQVVSSNLTEQNITVINSRKAQTNNTNIQKEVTQNNEQGTGKSLTAYLAVTPVGKPILSEITSKNNSVESNNTKTDNVIEPKQENITLISAIASEEGLPYQNRPAHVIPMEQYMDEDLSEFRSDPLDEYTSLERSTYNIDHEGRPQEGPYNQPEDMYRCPQMNGNYEYNYTGSVAENCGFQPDVETYNDIRQPSVIGVDAEDYNVIPTYLHQVNQDFPSEYIKQSP